MSRSRATPILIAAGLAAAAALSGCMESRMHLSEDFGVAVRQDAAAQIADPDAQYVGDPAPGSSGSRVGLAQGRYQRNAVIRPATTATSTAVAGATSGGGGSGGGAGESTGPR